MTELLVSLVDGDSVLGNDGTGQTVGGGLVADFEGLLVLPVGIDVGGEHRGKDLFPHGQIVGSLGPDHRGLDEVTDRLIPFASDNDLGIGTLAGVVDVGHGGVEALLVDHGVEEVVKISGITGTGLDVGDHRLHGGEDGGGQ